ncbi:expressed unknown protein [Seminavis robusta]|uniref:Uncharacterized protein n=1 Tax=Seminavis robusta TaxID=568900 RepID=A0A9N8HRS8_9STRA|nr:expressed unknown protein [Seminavis robusta]|eukprot:Sro1101_g241400.1 n/a (576) ;mRNA; f:12239-14149
MMNISGSPSRRSVVSTEASATLSPGPLFGTPESLGGVAGDSSIGLSEEIGANHSITTGSDSLPRSDKRRTNNGARMQVYEDDSVMLWAEDPESHYFEYILQQEQEQRAKMGKSAEDSLIGESTIDEIQQHQSGGQESSEAGTLTLGASSFPILSTYNIKGGGNSLFGGFSLASTEKSKKPTKRENKTEEPPVAVLVDNFYPSFIYVGDTASKPGNCSKDCSQDVRRLQRGRCFYIIVFFLGSICLSGSAVAVYLTLTTRGRKDTSSSSVSASFQGTAGTTIPPVSQLNDATWRPSTITIPTLAPSALLHRKTHQPTRIGDAGDLFSPTQRPYHAATSDATTAPTNDQTATTDLSLSPSWDASNIPSNLPTRFPTTQHPSTRPPTTIQPSLRPSTFQPSLRPSTTTTLSCGCNHCSSVWDMISDEYTCGDRIEFLVFERGYSETGACALVAGVEFPLICGPCDPNTCNVGNYVYNVGNVVSANEAPPDVALSWKGGNGFPADVFPLGRCEGDCDSDDDCAGGLLCFGRHPFESVPGCRGGDADYSRTDYCVPENHALQHTEVGTSRNSGDDFFTAP